MKKYIILSILGFMYLSTYAQSDADILNYSTTQYIGTARSIALGGTGASTGADFAGLSINPASIGLYRKSELIVTPCLKFENTNSEFLNTNTKKNNFKFSFSNLGIVNSNKIFKEKVNSDGGIEKTEQGAWAWSIGMNKIKDFTRTTKISGTNPDNSFVDRILESVNNGYGYSPTELNTYFPYDAAIFHEIGIITPLYIGDSIYYESALSNTSFLQTTQLKERGAINEIVIGIGGNIKNKLYLGGMLNVPILQYRSTIDRSEEDTQNIINGLSDYTFNEDIKVSGTGIGAKVGAIYRIHENARIGAAIHTPVSYNLTDQYSTYISGNDDMGQNYNAESTESNILNYIVHTPWHYLLSATVFYAKKGFLTIDYEYMDYSTSFLNFRDSDAEFTSYENDLNKTIENKYNGSHNLKFGLEYLIKPELATRIGYAYYPSPFSDGNAVAGFDQRRYVYSGGVGYRADAYFVDLGIAHTQSRKYLRSYTLIGEQVPGANIKNGTTILAVSFGVRF